MKNYLKNSLIFFAVITIFSLGLPSIRARAQNETSKEAIILTAVGPLTPAMREYIQRGLELAERRNSEIVVIRLDTPGGSGGLMDEIVQSILASPVPVVVYVAPQGAIAASAGTIITLAADIAAMAPGTAIGAASPVSAEGEDLGETLARKAKEIVRAQIRELAKDRNAEAIALAEDTVENAVAVSAVEALEIGLVDIIARDVPDLLSQLNGWQLVKNGEARTLNTAFLTLNNVNITFIEQLLSILTNPNIVFLLLTFGINLILLELSNPGGWVAGFLGTISLLMAGYGLGVLPVNWVWSILLIVAFALFYMEVTTPSKGAFSIGGVIAFVAGALLMFNSGGTPEFYRVSVPMVVATGMVMAGTIIAILAFMLKALKAPVRTGQVALIGKIGIVKSDLIPNKRGSINLAGEIWTTELLAGEKKIKKGQRVEVVALDGLRLIVKKPDAKQVK